MYVYVYIYTYIHGDGWKSQQTVHKNCVYVCMHDYIHVLKDRHNINPAYTCTHTYMHIHICTSSARLRDNLHKNKYLQYMYTYIHMHMRAQGMIFRASKLRTGSYNTVENNR